MKYDADKRSVSEPQPRLCHKDTKTQRKNIS